MLDRLPVGCERGLEALTQFLGRVGLACSTALADVLWAEFAERRTIGELENVRDAGGVAEFLVAVKREV